MKLCGTNLVRWQEMCSARFRSIKQDSLQSSEGCVLVWKGSLHRYTGSQWKGKSWFGLTVGLSNSRRLSELEKLVIGAWHRELLDQVRTGLRI